MTATARPTPNLSYALTQAARRVPNQEALVRADHRWTWAELDDRVHCLAAAMSDAGITAGSVVMMHTPNCLDMITTMYATWRLGAVWAPTNYRLFPDEVSALAQLCRPDLFICHANYPDHAPAVGDIPVWALTTEPDDVSAVAFAANTVAGQIAANRGRRVPEVVPREDDAAWYFFTSGTSGTPKAAVLTHHQMAFVVTNHLCDLMPDLRDSDATLILAPISHGAGVHLTTHVARAAKVVLLPEDRLNAETAWTLIEREHVTTLFTVPTILARLTQHDSVRRHDHSSLRYVIYAGAPITAKDQRSALDALGPVLVQYYGLGEVTGNITVQPTWMHGIAPDADGIPTAGFERTGTQISIQDPTGQPLDIGERGEVCVCGPAVFAGYLKNPEANERAFRNGWFRTGDLGYLSEAGLLYLTGRASDMFISGGSNVDPREIEEKMLTHPDIAQVGVVGVPDPQWGEVGYAVCVPRPGATLDEDDVVRWCRSKMAGYKVPRRVLSVAELATSGYGKVTRELLRDQIRAQQAWPATTSSAGAASDNEPRAELTA